MITQEEARKRLNQMNEDFIDNIIQTNVDKLLAGEKVCKLLGFKIITQEEQTHFINKYLESGWCLEFTFRRNYDIYNPQTSGRVIIISKVSLTSNKSKEKRK